MMQVNGRTLFLSKEGVRRMTAVELNHVFKSYSGKTAVHDLSFSVIPGEILGLIGPNGAGKSTSIKTILNFIKPDSGDVTIFGGPLNDAGKNRLGYLPEERGLYKKLSAIDLIIYLASLKGMDRHSAKRNADSLLDQTGMLGNKKMKIEAMSKGMAQMIQIVVTIIHDPKLIILDEPFSGLDPASALALKDALLELAKNGKTILLSTHRMDQAERLCQSICLINHGRAVLEGDLDRIKATSGHCSVQIKYDGDASFLRESKLVQSSNDYGNYVEVRLAPGADTQELLRLACSKARVDRFEVMQPSLEEIFIEAVSKPHA